MNKIYSTKRINLINQDQKHRQTEENENRGTDKNKDNVRSEMKTEAPIKRQ